MRGLRAALQRSTGRAREPRLSVVVPVYDMEEFLASCLDSLLAQTFQDFEAVVVIDGATDGSQAIAEEYAERDGRVRVISQANAGLGAARNTGVRESRASHLTFLDSDDQLPPQAYATMMETIERTGSDMVVGTLKRDTGRRRQAMRLMRENHRARREQVTLPEMPLMLADVFATNKVFRRAFWDEAGLAFPEHFHYEDQPTLTRAFLAADRFDVIPETVYLWRVRGDQSSITQRRHELDDLVDRIESKRVSTAIVRESEAPPEVLDAWFRDILPVDMWEYFRSVPGASEEYWTVLRSAVQEFWNDDTVRFDHTRAPAQQRYMGWLVDRGRREDLEQLVAFIDEHRGDIPVQLREDHVVAELPGVGDPEAGPPASVYVLGDHEQKWECWITSADWEGDLLHLGGFALIRNVPTHASDTELRGELVADGDSATWPLTLLQEQEPRATRFVGRPRQDFDACGFRTTVDVGELVRSVPATTTWRLALHRRVELVEAEGGVTEFDGEQVDRSWHPLSDVPGTTARARLLPRGRELVLECRAD